MNFPYGAREIAHLRAADPALGAAIERIGPLERPVNPDLFASVVYNIIGQQITMKAQATIAARVEARFPGMAPAALAAADPAEIQRLGMSGRKVGYIQDFAQKVTDGRFDLAAIAGMRDREAISALTTLRGVGVWTAEMLLLFSLARPDVLSYDDLAIRRGLMRLHGHDAIDRPLFETYRARYSPYGSTASLYLWEIAGENPR